MAPAAFAQWKWLRPHTVLGRVTLWSFGIWLILWPLDHFVRSAAGEIAAVVRFFALVVFLVFGFLLLFRWFRRKFLWRLSNRLVVTYLLVGLAPFALLTILFGLIAYVFAGQFAIFAATGEMDRQVAEMATDASEINQHLIHMDEAAWKQKTVVVPEAALDNSDNPNRTLNVYRNGQAVVLGAGMPPSEPLITGAPAWTGDDYQGIVRDHGRVYARAVRTRSAGGQAVTVIASELITSAFLSRAAEGLGRVSLTRAVSSEGADGKPETPEFGITASDGSSSDLHVQGRSLTSDEVLHHSTSGGTLAPASHWFDINVTFFTPMSLRDWVSGKTNSMPFSVASRPSLLYHRLFTSSVELGLIVRWTLISVAVLFAVFELIALLMAVSLNRTITRSVAALYQGTLRVDAGDLTHRIPVRSQDQLGDLGRSFNTMTSSLVRLLDEQKEKERLQNELNIAKEVQANLFPHGDIRLRTLEVHGYNRPARTVGGDYYDFLLFGPMSLGLALGDISGKGISAALLMATLHSAVRAYRFAAEELADTELMHLTLKPEENGSVSDPDTAEMFESPGKILSLLNRHLYRSTQPEKYATLWLGFYDGLRGTLTYSNGGQLPPLVLCSNDEVKRLDCGGTVVGLMDNQTYHEDSVKLSSGDILIAYSDGVTEPENEFGDFGEERLLEIVRQHRTAPLKTIADHVMQALTDWIGTQEQPDDITLVLARQL